MDNTLVIYCIKVSVSLALFYALHALCLKKDTFFLLRRAYFLFAIVFSLVFPLINIEIPLRDNPGSQVPAYWLSQLDVYPGAQPGTGGVDTGIWNSILMGFISISIILLLRFLIQVASIVNLKINNESEKADTCHIIRLKNENSVPFSFFNWIFINPDNRSLCETEEMIAHERVHVKQFHSIDVIIAELLCVCFWWNPFAWLIRKEIKINLEYLADDGVIQSGIDTKAYQYILLQTTDKNTGIPIINNFNVSQLKKRIAMMNKKRTTLDKSLKYLFILPLGVFLLLGNAVRANPSVMDNLLVSKDNSSLDADEQTQKKKDYTPFVAPEVMPQFPGGVAALMEYTKVNLKYPESAQKKGIEGRTVIRFVIKETGEIADITVIKGFDPDCDNEAKRLVETMPDWIPGTQGGKAVSVYFTMPIVFKLAQKTSAD